MKAEEIITKISKYATYKVEAVERVFSYEDTQILLGVKKTGEVEADPQWKFQGDMKNEVFIPIEERDARFVKGDGFCYFEESVSEPRPASDQKEGTHLSMSYKWRDDIRAGAKVLALASEIERQ